MSCDHLASHAIGAFGASLPAETRTQLQAVYDQPGQLQRGEDLAALTRAAKALVLRLRASGADVPEHLDAGRPGSRAALKFGRLSLALAQAEAAVQQRQREAELAAAAAVREQALRSGDDPEVAAQLHVSDVILRELREEEQAREAAVLARPTTPAMRQALRGALDADPLLEDEAETHKWKAERVPNISQRGPALADRIASLPPAQVPTSVFQALERRQQSLDLADRLRESDEDYTSEDYISDRADAELRFIRAVTEESAPPAADPNLPSGAWVRTSAAMGSAAEVPVGSLGWVDEWRQDGMAMIAFEKPFRTVRGDEWLRGDDDDTPDERYVRYGFRPRELARLDGREALDLATARPHPGDRAMAVARLVATPMRPEDRQAAVATTLAAVDALGLDTYEGRAALSQLLRSVVASPHLDDAERRAVIDAVTPSYVARLQRETSNLSFDREAPVIARLDRAAQDALLPAIRACEPYWRALTLARLVGDGGRADLADEVRALAAALPDKHGDGADRNRVLALMGEGA